MVSTPHRDDKNDNLSLISLDVNKVFQPLIGTIKTKYEKGRRDKEEGFQPLIGTIKTYS